MMIQKRSVHQNREPANLQPSNLQVEESANVDTLMNLIESEDQSNAEVMLLPY